MPSDSWFGRESFPFIRFWILLIVVFSRSNGYDEARKYILFAAARKESAMDLLQYVNICQGSKSQPRFSHGNTLPLIQRPYGFAVFAPQTNSERGAWFYHPEDRSFEGIRLTHEPSPWIGDWAPLVITAQTEHPYGAFWQSWSGFDPETSVMTPGYLKVHLKRPDALIELTPAEYGGWFRISFRRTGDNFLSVLAPDQNYDMWFEQKYNRLHCQAVLKRNQEKLRIFCVFSFPEGTLDPGKSFGEDGEGKHLSPCENVLHRAYHLAVKKSSFCFQVGVSYISDHQALCNLRRELKYESFDVLREENHEIWNQTLGKIRIEADNSTRKTFYSCLYRASLFPHKAWEPDEEGHPIHYAPALDEVKPGYRYTDNGFWDTYRTVYPFLSIMAPGLYREILEGYLNDYRDSGWLPRWTAGGACDCMPGTAIDVVIADAAVKGILTGDALKTAFQAMLHHATEVSPRRTYGRMGIREFESLGYMPCDRYGESVNLTLDASYCDYCISAVAGILGETEFQKVFARRSENYKNVFDKETGFMRGKDSRGRFRKDFDPCRWGTDYTEASAWQTTFAVQHDFPGLARLMGGREKFLEKLDRLFAEKPDYLVGSYCQEIHEMTEMAACRWGQCALSNQPSFHIPYLYAFFGQPEKTAYWVRRACREGFSWENDGFPGDEDNGSMALWYVFAVLGIYPICPGKPIYTHIPPQAETIEILGRKVDLQDLGAVISHEELMKRILG